MSEQLHERVTDVLDRADTESGSALSQPDESESDDSTAGVLEAAEEANALLEESDPRALLEAVGLDTLPDGSEPASIPEAIARGDPDEVEDLRRLLRLAKLADRSGDDLEGAVGELRDRIGDGADGEPDESAEREVDDGGDEESEPADESTDEESTDDAETDETEDEAGAEGTTDDLADRLRSSMESSLGSFSDDIEGLQAKLEEATAGMGGDDGAEDAAADETAAEEADTDERAADAEDEDDGLLDPDLGGSQDRGTSSGGPSRYSTMAPPPSKRADMKGTARHSTMPGKR